jgi:PucR C-terminal helix-turn-helix domain/GGDEF-like domain
LKRASAEQAGTAIAVRLRDRRSEIEQAILTRVYSVSESPRSGGPEYAEGLRTAIAAGVEYGIEGIERGERSTPPIPEALLAQARLAARSGVRLDTVLRRYFAGHTLIDDYMVEEAEREELLSASELKPLLRSQATIVDRLLAAVSSAYSEEVRNRRRPQSRERRRAERVERLLAGELLDTRELAYEFDGWHIGLVAAGAAASEALAAFARFFDVRLLAVRREEAILWAWLGSRRRLDPGEVESAAALKLPDGLALAIGEAGEGVGGWRLTHRQASAALSVVLRQGERTARYADVALLASMLRDDLLVTSLRRIFLAPLAEERDGGATARQTLLAYFEANRNTSSAAALLGVSRQTVGSRLRSIEERIGRPLSACANELEAAMRLVTLPNSRSST